MNVTSIISISIHFCAGIVLVAACLDALADETQRTDIIVADFEDEGYGEWVAEDEAFGSGPASGTLPGQMRVDGFDGKGLVNSFLRGDRTTGKLTSPEFEIERPWINFLIGGGGYAGETCVNLLIDGKVARTATGPNTKPGGSEELQHASWHVEEFVGTRAVIQIVDQRRGGWGHINVDQIVQSDAKAASTLVVLEKTLDVNDTHLIIPVANNGTKAKKLRLGIYDGEAMVQDFNVSLPLGDDAYWLAAYPLEPFGLMGKQIKIAPARERQTSESCRAAFNLIKVGSASDAHAPDDYVRPYRNQFHASARRGWNNDPNGMVYHGGKYHLFYQHNPFGIFWGNMHWGHFESTDLVHWESKPIAPFQKTVGDMAFSGGGFVDFNNSSGLGKNTLFVAFTSTGRGECLAYSKDEGLTFTEIPENPVVKHKGRDPKIIWYEPDQKWVMAIYDSETCEETETTAPGKGFEKRAAANIAFWESKDLRHWNRTGAFTDADRDAVFECPELFELPIEGRPNEFRWILYGAQNRYFMGRFNGKTFEKESGPHGSRHGAFYAAQTFSDVPDGRRIQVGWVRTASYQQQFPDQIVNQALSLPHEMTLRETDKGLRVFYSPVTETERLRRDVLVEGKDVSVGKANEMLQTCRDELTEVMIEFAEEGPKELVIDGIDASFNGRSAQIFTDRTFNEIYADDGKSYELRTREARGFDSSVTQVTANDGAGIRSLKVYRLQSIWAD